MASTGDSAPGDRHQAEQRRVRIGPFGDLRRDRSNDESQDQKGAGAEDELPLAGAPPGSIDGFRMVMSDVYAGGDLAGHGMRRIAERADALLDCPSRDAVLVQDERQRFQPDIDRKSTSLNASH